MAQFAMLNKIAHFIQEQGTRDGRPLQPCNNYDHKRCPSPMRVASPGTMVARLTTMIEIGDGRPLDEVPAYRRDAYVYATLAQALEAYDDETNAEPPDIQVAILRSNICAASHLCECEECGGDATLEQHMHRCLRTRYPNAPLLQLELEGPERMVLIERVWLRLPRIMERGRGNTFPNPWEVVVPERSILDRIPTTHRDEELSDSDHSSEGVPTSDEEEADD
ncbi:hypothetical protein Y032_0448g1646 [Ancylostoma ceylanicum]|uniref:Uncharacterized protein n=1 Tax=Ancylostoma ceylanicum TaxID=53326 RepID=A0A016X0P0_9BILA|nr:hypothetical protein Y032_0448g1646 [Ancylostoma ceylanicum]